MNERFVIQLEYPIKPRVRFGGSNLPPHRKLYDLINRNRDQYDEHLQAILRHVPILAAIPTYSRSDQVEVPYWLNNWFPPLDAAALYCILTETNPKRFFEIGSGNSTKFARHAIRNHSLQTITSVDPCPRAEIDAICDRIVRVSLESVDVSLFEELESGDILFVDSSHRAFMNSDVTVIFLEILPYLKPGVLVHFHDIFLPHDYPEQWVTRYYNEQYLLAVLLLSESPRYEIFFPSFFVLTDPLLSERIRPFWDQINIPPGIGQGGSFWIRTK